MTEIKLDRLENDFKNEQSIIYSNCSKTISSINEIIDILSNAGWIDKIVFKQITNSDDDLFNRNYRMWRLNTIENIQEAVNTLSTIFEVNGLLDAKNHEVIPKVNLFYPLKPSFDDEYKDSMNSNFVAIEQTINNFYSALKDAGLTTD